jgi:hypothetical protein
MQGDFVRKNFDKGDFDRLRFLPQREMSFLDTLTETTDANGVAVSHTTSASEATT